MADKLDINLHILDINPEKAVADLQIPQPSGEFDLAQHLLGETQARRRGTTSTGPNETKATGATSNKAPEKSNVCWELDPE